MLDNLDKPGQNRKKDSHFVGGGLIDKADFKI